MGDSLLALISDWTLCVFLAVFPVSKVRKAFVVDPQRKKGLKAYGESCYPLVPLLPAQLESSNPHPLGYELPGGVRLMTN